MKGAMLNIETTYQYIIISDTYTCTEEGYFPDPTDCRRFYRCSKNSKHAFSCPRGLGFDSLKITCDPIEQVRECAYKTDLSHQVRRNTLSPRQEKTGLREMKQQQRAGQITKTKANSAKENRRRLEDKFYLNNFDGMSNFDEYISLEEAAKMDYQVPEGLLEEMLVSNRHWNDKMAATYKENLEQTPTAQYIEPKEGQGESQYGTYNPWNIPYVDSKRTYMPLRKRTHTPKMGQSSPKIGAQKSSANHRNMPQIQDIPASSKKTEPVKERKAQVERKASEKVQNQTPDPKYSIEIEWDSNRRNRGDNSYDIVSADIAYDYPYEYDQLNTYPQYNPYMTGRSDRITNVAKEGMFFRNPYHQARDPYASLSQNTLSPKYIPYEHKGKYLIFIF